MDSSQKQNRSRQICHLVTKHIAYWQSLVRTGENILMDSEPNDPFTQDQITDMMGFAVEELQKLPPDVTIENLRNRYRQLGEYRDALSDEFLRAKLDMGRRAIELLGKKYAILL